MKRFLAILTCVLLAVGAAGAQPAGPTGPAPKLLVVSKTIPKKGHIVVFYFQPVTETYLVVEKIDVNGKFVDVTRARSRTVYKSVEVTMDIGDGRIITPDGKQLPVDEVWKRAKPGTVIAWSADGKMPNPVYLRALNAETVLIIEGSKKSSLHPENKR